MTSPFTKGVSVRRTMGPIPRIPHSSVKSRVRIPDVGGVGGPCTATGLVADSSAPFQARAHTHLTPPLSSLSHASSLLCITSSSSTS